VGTFRSNPEQHEKPEDNQRCTKQKPEGAFPDFGKCEEHERTPQRSEHRTDLDGRIRVGGTPEPWCAEGEGATAMEAKSSGLKLFVAI
jgi:hypothetical protein